MRRLFLCLIAAAAGTFGFARGAAAYPQFQFSSGTNKCSQCHFSPAGGGLLSSWGRSESGDTISMGGDGGFLHGAVTLPSWVALGFDLRLAGVRNDDGGQESPRTAFFPMQADAYARFAFNDSFSLYLEGGVRGETRPQSGFTNTGVGQINYDFGTVADRFISREHYAMWRPSATGPYARVGRFYAPYGLRFVEHIYYVRRYTGYELYNETYNLSGGFVSDDWEVHASLFTPPPTSFPDQIQSVGTRESGGAVYFEKRFADKLAIAPQFRAGVGRGVSRYQGGLVGKLWLEPAKLLLLAEGDFIIQQVDAAAYSQNQFVSYTGATFFPVRGVMAAAAFERFQENLGVKGTGRNSILGQVNVFPWAHCEVVLLFRYQMIGNAGEPAATLGMFQLHYYL